MGKFKKILDSFGYKGFISIIVIILIITLITLVIYFNINKTKERFDVTYDNLEKTLNSQFDQCFSGNVITTLNATDLQTLSAVDSITPTDKNNRSKYKFFNENKNIFTSIKNNLSQKLFIYAGDLKKRLTDGYCINVGKNENVRNYTDFDNIFKTELKNIYTIILCCIKKYKKLYLFRNSTDQTYTSISGDLSADEMNDLKNQLYCMLRLKINITNTVQDMNDFAFECTKLIENFAKSASCDAVTNRSIDGPGCYNICAANLTSDTLYGMIKTPSTCDSERSSGTLPTFSPTNANVLNKNTAPPTQINGYNVNSNAFSFTGNNTLIIQGLNSLSTAPGTTAQLPSGTNAPSGTTAPPSGTNAPSGTTAPPSGTTAPPSGTTAPPSGTTAPPSGTTAPPSRTNAPPSGTTAPGTTTPGTTSTNEPETTRRPRQYHHHPMTLPYDIPEMPGPFLPLYSNTYPSNALRDDPYASFNNEDYYVHKPQGIDINLQNAEGNNNFFMPQIILDEE